MDPTCRPLQHTSSQRQPDAGVARAGPREAPRGRACGQGASASHRLGSWPEDCAKCVWGTVSSAAGPCTCPAAAWRGGCGGHGLGARVPGYGPGRLPAWPPFPFCKAGSVVAFPYRLGLGLVEGLSGARPSGFICVLGMATAKYHAGRPSEHRNLLSRCWQPEGQDQSAGRTMLLLQLLGVGGRQCSWLVGASLQPRPLVTWSLPASLCPGFPLLPTDQ